MNEVHFYERLLEQFKSQLPFVAYRKPGQMKLKAFLLDETKLYRYEKNQPGFIFAPFDDLDTAIFFPSEVSEHLEADIGSETDGYLTKKEAYSEDNFYREFYIDLVQRAIDRIRETDLQKVVLSRPEIVPFRKDPIELFRKLLSTYPTAFTYCWYHPEVGCWLGATPETLLKLRGLHFKTMALAGTQPYRGQLAVEWGAKEREEQQMVTDEIVNSTRLISDSVKVSEVNTVKAGHLLHLQTMVSGILKSDHQNPIDLIKKLHPTPAVCGLPRNLSKAFIENNEGYDREFYTGFLGEMHLRSEVSRNKNRKNVENNAYQSQSVTSELYVNLRCMKLEQEKATIFVGGGITGSSNPQSEWSETVEKSKTIKRLLD